MNPVRLSSKTSCEDEILVVEKAAGSSQNKNKNAALLGSMVTSFEPLKVSADMRESQPEEKIFEEVYLPENKSSNALSFAQPEISGYRGEAWPEENIFEAVSLPQIKNSNVQSDADLKTKIVVNKKNEK